MRNHSKIWLPHYRAITTHSLRSKSRMCCYLYSLFKILFTYCMYIIVNKATFMTNDAIKAIIKNNIKLINTTSLSDSKLSKLKWQHRTTYLISIINYYIIFIIKNQYIKNKISYILLQQIIHYYVIIDNL